MRLPPAKTRVKKFQSEGTAMQAKKPGAKAGLFRRKGKIELER
jgi:hypothetical protein